ncbi:MAG: DUF2764 domain-containing protein [Treponema sp.]|nr:DUF2764 domain-containing protein [Treponema sp.]
MAYYYLVSQLPYLIYGQAVPLSSVQFKSLCKTALRPQDAALLEWCTLDPDPEVLPLGAGKLDSYRDVPRATPSPFLNQWRHWERALRLNLARYRAQALGQEGAAPVDPPEDPVDVGAIAKAALGLESPLEAELFLDQARWNAIEGMQGFDYFGVNTIYAYLLRLLLMERRASFSAEEGFAVYKELYTAIMAAAGGLASEGGRVSEISIESGEPK